MLLPPHFSNFASLLLWDPPPNSVDAALFERTQRFALRVCSCDWKANSYFLLTRLCFFPLSTRCSISKLILLFKILHNLTHLPHLHNSLELKSPPNYSLRSFDHLILNSTYCKSKTHATSVSFLSSVINLWNCVPVCISSSSLSSFKSHLLHHYFLHIPYVLFCLIFCLTLCNSFVSYWVIIFLKNAKSAFNWYSTSAVWSFSMAEESDIINVIIIYVNYTANTTKLLQASRSCKDQWSWRWPEWETFALV